MKSRGFLLLTICLVLIGFLGYVVIYGLPLGKNKEGEPVALLPATEAITYGLDLKGGVTITYMAAENVTPTSEELKTAEEIIRSRLDAKGYFDATVTTTQKNRLVVEIPNLTDPQQAVKELGKTALLELIDVGQKSVKEDQVLTEEDGQVILAGTDVIDARAVKTGKGQGWEINFTITEDAKKRFAKATERLAPKHGIIAITLDKRVISAPVVQSKINSKEARITGDFTENRARTLARLIKSGALPFELEAASTEYVGPLLGQNALDISIKAGLIGLLLVILYMIIFYRVPGSAAAIALIAYVAIVLFIFARTNITLTLPGIAGIILSIGMAVDANVIIFERLKEELREGKTLRGAIKDGFSRAWPAIRDANITTIISSAVLYLVGTGPIKGFAVTLIIGIIVSMLSAILLTRFIINQYYNIGIKDTKLYCVKEEKA